MIICNTNSFYLNVNQYCTAYETLQLKKMKKKPDASYFLKLRNGYTCKPMLFKTNFTGFFLVSFKSIFTNVIPDSLRSGIRPLIMIQSFY